MNRFIFPLLLLLVFILVTYIVYRLTEREMKIRRKAAEDRAKELSTTEEIESIYKNDREFRRRMNKRDLFILAGLFAFFCTLLYNSSSYPLIEQMIYTSDFLYFG